MSRRVVGWLLWSAGPLIGVAICGAIVAVGAGLVVRTAYPDYLVVGALGAYAALLLHARHRWSDARQRKKAAAQFDDDLRRRD